MTDPVSIQKREIDLMVDAPLADLFTVHLAGSHILLQNVDCQGIPLGVFSHNDRIVQTLDVEMQTAETILTESKDFVDSFLDPPSTEIMHGLTSSHPVWSRCTSVFCKSLLPHYTESVYHKKGQTAWKLSDKMKILRYNEKYQKK